MCYKDGYVYTAGDYDSTLQIESTIFPVNGGTDVYFAKWDTAGNLIWAKTISHSGTQRIAGLQVIDNEIILAGSFDSIGLQIGSSVISSIGGQDIFMAKYDTSGNSTALYGYGNAGNDTIRSLCVDYNHDIYVGGDSLYKFSTIGIKQWAKPVSVNNVYYSKIDSTIVTDYNGASTSGASGFTVFYNDILIKKLSLNGDSIWLATTTTASNFNDLGPYLSAFNAEDGSHFHSFRVGFILGGTTYCFLEKTAPNGTLSNVYYNSAYQSFPLITNISSNKDYVMFSLKDNGNNDFSSYIYNYYSGNFYKKYNYMPYNPGSYRFVDTNMIFANSSNIYTFGTSSLSNYTFGQFGPSLLQSNPTNTSLHVCNGSSIMLTGNANGGLGNFTYSWSPSSGLSSTNTLSTQCTPTASTTYILTINDQIGQIIKDTFNVIIDTPVTVNITSQFPSFCNNNTMSLYSNITGGTSVSWYKLNNGVWSIFYYSNNTMINSPGQYYCKYINTCGTYTDTIAINSDISTSINSISVCPNQLPFNFNGQSLTQSGTYYDTIANSVGCDSIVTLNFSVNPISNTSSSVVVCSNQLPYTWNGQNLTTNGTYTHQTTNVTGCDSIVTLNFTVNQTTSSSGSMAVCSNQLPYTWNGQNLTTNGTYTHQTTNVAGCDSIVTLNFTVNQTTSSSGSITVCSIQLPYTWNGQALTSTGTYTHQTTNVAGCDSIVTLNFTVNQTTSSSGSITVCSIQLPYTWNGQALTSTGIYTHQTTNVAGCDSIVTLNFTVNQTTSSSGSMAVCSNQLPYTWNGQNLTTNGTYTHQTTNVAGCDSIVTLNFSVNPISNTSSSVVVCSNQLPYTWNGQNLTTNGTYTHQTTNVAGCDSIVTLNFTVNQTTSSSGSMAVCSNQLPYTWNGQNLTTNGTYTHQTTNVAGCDSIVTLNFTVNQTTSSSDSMAVCSNQLPFTWNGQTLTSTGIYAHQTTNAIGCDSIVTLNFTVNQTTSSSGSMAVCSNQLPYTWNGQNLTTNGTYTHQTTNVAGCDSIVTLNFTVNQTTSSSGSMAVCSNQLPYTWNGQNLTTNGTYTHQTTNVAGCDSIVTLNFTVNQTTSSNTSLSIDPNLLPFTWNGQTISNGGIYSHTFIDINGCDSIVTIDISISPLSINPIVNVEEGHIFLYPNPTSNTITLAYSLTESSSISIKLFDVAGKLIAELTRQEIQNKGKHLKEINLRKLGISSGTYFLQVNDGIRNWNERVVYQE